MIDFHYHKGRCLECDIPIPRGRILCLMHTPDPPSQHVVTRVVMISEMKEGQVGFTEPGALFEVDGKLFIVGTAQILPQSEGYKTARVEVKHHIFEIDRNTIDTDDIYVGWPDFDNQTDCYQAKLV